MATKGLKVGDRYKSDGYEFEVIEVVEDGSYIVDCMGVYQQKIQATIVTDYTELFKLIPLEKLNIEQLTAMANRAGVTLQAEQSKSEIISALTGG